MNRATDILARRLHEAGCRTAIGMPGGEVLTLVDSLVAAGIKFVLCKHENAAGFMAEGTYHRTGAPGILVATVGPGAANGVNVVANAEQDRVPLIVLTGCVDPDEALCGRPRRADQGDERRAGAFDHPPLVDQPGGSHRRAEWRSGPYYRQRRGLCGAAGQAGRRTE
jgi:thiamine pyrophosphate-dependent acetolactate synthase large subunit-like protein